MIRQATLKDIPAITDIYNHYVNTSIVTFDETPLSTGEMQSKMEDIVAKYPFLVHEMDQKVVGYAYASSFRAKIGYRNSVETTIYLHPDYLGKGIGLPLYSNLMDELKKMGLHTVIGGLSVPNEGSVILHKKLGFEKVAHFKEVGYKFNQWIDVEFWQLILT